MLEFSGIFAQQDLAAGGGAAPSYVTFWRTAGWTSNPTNHYLTFGTADSIPAGDILLGAVGFDGNVTVSCTGWTVLHQYSNSSGTGGFLAKVCDGSEGGTEYNFVTSGGESGGGIFIQLTGFGGSLDNHVDDAGGVITRSGTGFAPPPLTPSFGAAPSIWVIYSSTSLTSYPTAMPAGWTEPTPPAGVTGTAGAVIRLAYQELNTATHQPGIIESPSQTGTATCGTIAIKGT